MADLVGTRELARHLGVTPAAVSKAVREGRIQPDANRKGRNLFDLDKVRKIWAPMTATPPAGIPPPSPTPPGEEDVPGAATDNQRYAKARADKEEALAEQEALELERLRDTLLPRDEIVLTFTQFLRVASQRLIGIAPKLLSRYPGLSSAGRDFLAGELRSVLDGLAKWRPEK